MKKYIYALIIFTIISSSCYQRNKERKPQPLQFESYNDRNKERKPHPLQFESYNDSVSHGLWYSTIGLIAVEDIPQIKEIDSLENELKIKTQTIRDSIVNSFRSGSYHNSMDLTHDSIYGIVRQIINNKDLKALNAYYDTNDLLWHYGMGLYISEEIGFTPAYYNVYHFFVRKGRWIYKQKEISPEQIPINKEVRDFYLIFLTESERDLAIYSLIMCFKNGDISHASTLADLFEDGIFLPKNEKVAKKLKR